MPTLKQTVFRRMNTKASDLSMDNADLRLLVNAEYERAGSVRKVKGYEQIGDTLSAIISQDFNTQAEWLEGAFSSTATDGDTLILQGSALSQTANNDFQQIYGANYLAQSFVATSTSLTKIALYIDKVLGASLTLYEDFEAGTINPAKFTASGDSGYYVQTGGQLRLYLKQNGNLGSAQVVTDNLSGGDPIKGFRCFYQFVAESFADNRSHFVELTDGTNYIRLFGSESQWEIRLGGTYGSTREAIEPIGAGTIEVKEDGGDIKIYYNDVLKYTIASKTIEPASYFRAQATTTASVGDGQNQYIAIDNLYFYSSITALTDGLIEVQPDSSGAPSGTAITNGTATIDADDVTADKQRLDAVLATAATTVVGTTYWVVFHQTGGDSTNYYRLYKQNSDVYSGGALYLSSNSGGTWALDTDAPSDLSFVIYGSPASSGTWVSPNITLSAGQTLTQLTLRHKDLSGSNQIDRVDILNTVNAIQSSYTTDISSGTQTILYTADFSSGFTYTLNNTFRIKLTLASGGSITPVVESLILDSPTREIAELSPFYQSSGTKALLAVVADLVKRLTGSVWTTIKSGLTTGVDTDTTIFRASKGTILTTGTAASGNLTTLTAVLSPEPGPNRYQGKFIKIVAGRGNGQVRVIQSHTGTSTSTSTSSSTSTTISTSTTTTSTSTTRSTSTTKSTSTTTT